MSDDDDDDVGEVLIQSNGAITVALSITAGVGEGVSSRAFHSILYAALSLSYLSTWIH